MSADVFVYLDTVQFSKNGMQNRNQVKGPSGPVWLTVPVRQRLGQKIIEMRISEPHRLEKHVRSLAQSYGRTDGYRRWSDELAELLRSHTTSLCELAIATTEWLLQKLEVDTKRVRASDLPPFDEQRSRLVAGLCAHLGAGQYLTGAGALDYMDRADFSSAGCEVWVQEWEDLAYSQVFPEVGFLPELSTLDILLTHPRDARRLIGQAGSWRLLWGTR